MVQKQKQEAWECKWKHFWWTTVELSSHIINPWVYLNVGPIRNKINKKCEILSKIISWQFLNLKKKLFLVVPLILLTPLASKLCGILIFLQLSYISWVWSLIFKVFKSFPLYKLSRIKILLSILLNYCTSKHHGPSLNSPKLQIQASLPFIVSSWDWAIFFITTVW